MKNKIAEYQISLKIILRNESGEVLVLKNPDRGSLANFHDLPGGRIDLNETETPLELIIEREIKEEIGGAEYCLKMKPVSFGRHFFPAETSSDGKEKLIFFLFFEADYKAGNVSISDEHVGYKWVDLRTIPLEDFFKSGMLEGIKNYLNG